VIAMTTTRTAINVQTIMHIGRGNFLAISGGRFTDLNESIIALPVHYGYTVEFEYLPGPDLYEVRRMFRRGTRIFCKGVETRLYCDQVSESAYRASCFHDEFGGE